MGVQTTESDDYAHQNPLLPVSIPNSYETYQPPLRGFGCKKKTIFLFAFMTSLAFVLSMIVVMIILMVRHFGGSQSAGTIHGGIQGVYNSIGIPPITDVQLSGACSPGYTSYTLGYWPGTVKFCYDYGYIRTNYNSSECRNEYYARSSEYYTNWLGLQVCVKRTNAYNNGTNTCLPGYTLCYSGLCVYGNICPVTFAEISNSPGNYSDGSSTYLGNGRYFNIRRQNNTLGIGTFSFNIGQNTPCLSVNELPIQINYAAIRTQARGCVSYGAYPNSNALDTQNALIAFSYQPWSYSVTSLPQFSATLTSQLAYLSYSPRLAVQNTPFCQTIRWGDTMDADNKFSSAYNLTTGFSITIIVLLGIAFFGSLFAMFQGAKKTIPIFHGLFVIIGILLIPAVIVSKNRNQDVFNAMSMIDFESMSTCFMASGPQKVIQDYVAATSNLVNIQNLWLVAGLITWTLVAFNTVFVCCYSNKRLRKCQW